jgi:hypothetical protein
MYRASLFLASFIMLSIGSKILGRLTWLASNLVAVLPLFAISLTLAAFVVFALLGRRTVYLLLFVFALTAALYLINPMLSIYSNHGMAHLGFAYATERFHWPPEDPYFAGTSLHYPWGFDAMVGMMSTLMNISPGWVYTGCNLAALAVTVAAMAKITRLLDGDLVTVNCAVVLALLAPTLLGDGALDVLRPLVPETMTSFAFWGPEALPAMEKYSSMNAMPLGIAVGLVGLYKLLSIIKSVKYNMLDIISAAILIALIGYVYPHIWLTVCVIAVVCVAVAFRAGDRGKALALLAALVLGNLAVLLYLRALTGGRAQGQSAFFYEDPREYLYHLLHVAIILLPLWLLIALGRRSLGEQLRRSWVHRAALGSGLALLLAFLVMNAPGGVFKFRAMAIFCLAPLAAPGLKRIYDWNRTALVFILALQLMPFCYGWYAKTPWGWGFAAEPCYWQGTTLRHGLPEQDRLYQWIRENTPITAILIDNKPYVPVFAQRSLFVARQSNWNAEDWWSRRDGWLFHPDEWLRIIDGHSTEEIRRRNELVDALYTKADPRSGEDLAGRLGELTGDRAVFVVARNAWQKAALNSRPFLRKVADEEDWAVYAVEKDMARRRAAWRGATGRLPSARLSAIDRDSALSRPYLCS